MNNKVESGGFIFLGEFPFHFKLPSDNFLKSPSCFFSVIVDSSSSYNKKYFLMLSSMLNMTHVSYFVLFVGPQ
jgi:hypothetical protein